MADTKSKKRSASKGAGSSRKAKSSSAKPQSRSQPKSQSNNQSKSKGKTKGAKPKAAKSANAKSSKPKSSRSKSSGPKAKAPSSNGSSNGAGGGNSPVEAVRNAVGGAGQTVGKVASKAKVPLVAGGAAIAGAGGAMALAAASKGGRKKGMKGLKAAMPKKPKVKIKSGDLAKAAKEVGNFSAQMGELATELQRARESADENGKHRSPVEVVLQGLTARR